MFHKIIKGLAVFLCVCVYSLRKFTFELSLETMSKRRDVSRQLNDVDNGIWRFTLGRFVIITFIIAYEYLTISRIFYVKYVFVPSQIHFQFMLFHEGLFFSDGKPFKRFQVQVHVVCLHFARVTSSIGMINNQQLRLEIGEILGFSSGKAFDCWVLLAEINSKV